MHVLSHTHWDREWYQDFQGYRQRLVFQMDRMLDLLKRRREFRAFHLDGQTCLLSDYLRVRRDERERLAGHIRSGRVLIGPWFVMPDERLLSGESLVRNLMLGRRICREWRAKPMPIGYVTDVFGHVSQMPQILRGFGIDAAMLHRGTSCANEKSEMVWEGADGSEVLLIAVYQYTGYNDFLTFREWTDDELRAYEKRKLALATTDVLYALDGNDHQSAKWDIPEEIARANKVFTRIRCLHSSMPAYLAALRKALGKNWTRGRKRFAGELNIPAKEGQWSEVMNGFGSSRPYLKQANDGLEQLLARVAEPLHAWAVLCGGQSQKAFLDLAWRYLLLNHPHDSICGCSVDQVHRDMTYRFDQARLVATDSISESIQAVGDAMDTARLGESDAVVTVFNPSAAATGPVTCFSFEVKSELAAEKESKGLTPALLDGDGKPVCLEILKVERKTRAKPVAFITESLEGVVPGIPQRSAVPTPAYRPRFWPVDRWHVAAAAAVPALGMKTWRVLFKPRKNRARRPRCIKAVKADADARALENEFLRIAAKSDGSIDIFDKVTRTRYEGLHVFEDCGDAGEGWNYKAPARDRVILSTLRKNRGAVSIRVEDGGELSKAVRVAFKMRVPADLVDAETGRAFTGRERRTARSSRLATLGIETVFTLRAGERRVDCLTTVTNTAECHRLRVLFPTRRKTDAWYSDSAFDVVKRRVKLIDTTGWKEEMREWQVIKSFAAAADRRAGLAVLTKGLNEAAVRDDRERTLALTLFRAFRENLLHEITVDSQLLGDVVFEYAIAPFTPERGGVPAGIFAEVDRFKLPLFSYSRATQAGHAPAQATLVDIDAGAAISTVKASEDGKAIVARVFNPGTRRTNATITAGFAFARASRTDFEEKPLARLGTRGGKTIRLALGPKEVATVRFDLA